MRNIRNLDMLHNKLKGMEHRAPWKHCHILSLHTTSTCGFDQKVNKNSECGHVAYQIKGKYVSTNIEANTLTLNIPRRGVEIFFMFCD